MISLMYHYVRKSNSKAPYERILSSGRFKSDLERLSQKHTFLPVSDGLYSLKNKLCDTSCIALTFDDGLNCHYDVALFLAEKNIRATFYIPTAPFTSGDYLTVHVAHVISSIYGPKSLQMFIDAAHSLSFSVDQMICSAIDPKNSSLYSNNHEFDDIKIFKKIVNYSGDHECVKSILDRIVSQYDLRSHLKNYYLSLDQLRSIHQMGHEIGSHSVSHRLLSRLSSHDQAIELRESKDFLESELNCDIKSFSFPYGRKISYTQETLSLLCEIGYENAVSVESKAIKTVDESSVYELPRYDCNEIDMIFS